MRKSLKSELGNRIRFEYAYIDSFSNEKTGATFTERKLFSPTMLLVNLCSNKTKGGLKISVDHLWVKIYPSMLPLHLCAGDCISFTARPMEYEKISKSGKIVLEIGVDTIFNIKILSRCQSTEDLSFDTYLEKNIWDKTIVVPDTYLQYYYSEVVKTKNVTVLLSTLKDFQK